MGFGAFRVPTGEYRLTAEHLSVSRERKLYIDPSIWCVHGEYEASDKHIVTRSNVTAHLAQVHPFTLGWISDLHVSSDLPDHVREQVDHLSLCNPTITVFGGDIVSGSGVYLGSDIEDGWFRNIWDYAKDELSNNLWIKGNHDIDPNRYFYYNWFERLWTLQVGRFKFVGFDGYSEQSLCPGSCNPCPSLPDVLWLARRLREDDLDKVILVHQPLDQWCVFCPWVFKEVKIACAYAGHSHDIIYTKGPYKEIADIPDYINGSCSKKEVKLHVATLTLFTADGKEQTVLVDGGAEVKDESGEIEITAPGTVNWEKKQVVSTVPVRLVRRFEGHLLNLIALVPSGERARVRMDRKGGRKVEVSCDAELYVLGKEVYSRPTPYDSWTCSCGATWNSYRVEPGGAIELKFGGPL